MADQSHMGERRSADLDTGHTIISKISGSEGGAMMDSNCSGGGSAILDERNAVPVVAESLAPKIFAGR